MALQTKYLLDDPSLFAEFVATFDRNATRRHGEIVAGLVAKRVHELIDRHHCGLEVKPALDCPLKDALDAVRNHLGKPEKRLKIRARLVIASDHVAIEVTDHSMPFEDLIIQAGARAAPDTTDSPEGTALFLQVPQCGISTPKWTSVKNRIPTMEVRIQALSKSPDPTFRPDERRLRRFMPRDIGKDELKAYGIPGCETAPRPSTTVAPAKKASEPLVTGLIDHLDIVTTSDGHAFIAIMEAGLSPRNRLIVSVGSGEINFSQGGSDFGTVVEIPRSSLSVLRVKKFISVVEMKREGGRNAIHATHMAKVQDLSMERNLASVASAWRMRMTTTNKKAEKEWVERT